MDELRVLGPQLPIDDADDVNVTMLLQTTHHSALNRTLFNHSSTLRRRRPTAKSVTITAPKLRKHRLVAKLSNVLTLADLGLDGDVAGCGANLRDCLHDKKCLVTGLVPGLAIPFLFTISRLVSLLSVCSLLFN
uniref:(northern house mosquito) hypothetical protein n=1 Tax=Culex pipiens TaxID=7175 RepID=A0A8D8C038_CULPI